MSTYIIAYEDELYHHGIKGQKWGIRRYQNEDGSLTPEGERRYGHMKDFSNKTATTKRVMKDWWDLDDDSFKRKYYTSKNTYSKRVYKYGSPDVNSPMAIRGKELERKHLESSYNQKYKSKTGKNENEKHWAARRQRDMGIAFISGSIATGLGASVARQNGKPIVADILRSTSWVTAGIGTGNTIVGAVKMKKYSD